MWCCSSVFGSPQSAHWERTFAASPTQPGPMLVPGLAPATLLDEQGPRLPQRLLGVGHWTAREGGAVRLSPVQLWERGQRPAAKEVTAVRILAFATLPASRAIA